MCCAVNGLVGYLWLFPRPHPTELKQFKACNTLSTRKSRIVVSYSFGILTVQFESAEIFHSSFFQFPVIYLHALISDRRSRRVCNFTKFMKLGCHRFGWVKKRVEIAHKFWIRHNCYDTCRLIIEINIIQAFWLFMATEPSSYAF